MRAAEAVKRLETFRKYVPSSVHIKVDPLIRELNKMSSTKILPMSYKKRLDGLKYDLTPIMEAWIDNMIADLALTAGEQAILDAPGGAGQVPETEGEFS